MGLSGDKTILVTRDPVFVNKNIINGRYIGRRPENYMTLAIVVTVLNPILGPLALVFAFMSSRAYADGDLKYAEKWGRYALMWGMLTIGATVIIACAIAFSLIEMPVKGGHAP